MIKEMNDMKFLDLVEARRSVRSYRTQVVEREKVEYLLECARLAPSAVNFQPWRLFVVAGEVKHSFDKIEKKLDTAVPKEDFDTKIANHEAQIRKIQETYTPRTTHDKDVGELREKISRISENYLTKEDFYRENTKTDRKIESANQKIDRVIELQMQLLQQLSQKENS